MVIVIGQSHRRGDWVETIVHDKTRVGHPPAASVFERDGKFLVIPTNTKLPVQEWDNYNSAVNYIEQFIGVEHRRVA